MLKRRALQLDQDPVDRHRLRADAELDVHAAAGAELEDSDPGLLEAEGGRDQDERSGIVRFDPEAPVRVGDRRRDRVALLGHQDDQPERDGAIALDLHQRPVDRLRVRGRRAEARAESRDDRGGHVCVHAKPRGPHCRPPH